MPYRDLARRALIMLLAMLALVACTDLLAALARPLVLQHEHPLQNARGIGDVWRDIRQGFESGAQQRPTERRLTIEVERRSLIATYRLTVRHDSSVLRAVQAGHGENDPAGLVDLVLGTVTVAEGTPGLPRAVDYSEVLSFGPPRVHMDASSNVGWLEAVSRPYQLIYERPRLRIAEAKAYPKDDLVVVRTDDATVLLDERERGLIQSQSEAVTRIVRGGSELTVDIQRRDAATVGARLHSQGLPYAPVADTLVVSVLGLLPLALLFWLLRKESPFSMADGWSNVVGLLLLFAAGAIVLRVFAELADLAPDYLQSMAQSLLVPQRTDDTEGVGTAALLLLSALLLWPLAVVRLRRVAAPERPNGGLRYEDRRGKLWTAVLVAAALAGTATVLFVRNATTALSGVGGFQRPQLLAIVAGGAVVGLSIASFWLVRAVAPGSRWAAGLTATATLLLALSALRHQELFQTLQDRESSRQLEVNVIALGAFLLAASVASVAYAEVLVVMTRLAGGRRTGLARLAAVLLLVVSVVVPSTYLAAQWSPSGQAGPWTLLATVDALGALTGVAGLACLLLFLRFLAGPAFCPRPASETADLRVRHRFVRLAGIVFILYTFYWPDAHWLYIPVQLLVGWLMAAVVLLPWERADDLARLASALPHWDMRVPARVRERYQRRLLCQALRLHRAHDALRARRAELGREERSQEQDAAATESPWPSLLRVARSRSEPVEGRPAEIALGLLRRRDPWWHGLRGAGYGAVAGLPWTVIYLRDFAGDTQFRPEYPILGFLAEPAWIAFQWPLYGFFFGYFYPYLRGGNGVTKGWFLFLTIVGPQLSYNVLVPTAEGWGSLGLFTLQVLSFCLLMGLLAGDLHTLWPLGLGLSDLRELYNVRVLLAVASSIAVTGGATVAIWVWTGATIYTAIRGGGELPGTPPPGPSGSR